MGRLPGPEPGWEAGSTVSRPPTDTQSVLRLPKPSWAGSQAPQTKPAHLVSIKMSPAAHTRADLHALVTCCWGKVRPAGCQALGTAPCSPIRHRAPGSSTLRLSHRRAGPASSGPYMTGRPVSVGGGRSCGGFAGDISSHAGMASQLASPAHIPRLGGGQVGTSLGHPVETSAGCQPHLTLSL